jgi:hypothetical protein
MLLDQQYQGLMVRPNRDSRNRESSSTYTPVISPPAIARRPFEPVWNSPLSEKYFTMIQSFRIEILFYYPIDCGPYKPPGLLTPEKQRDLALRLSYYTDQLHRLIGRLCLRRRPIGRLEIVVKFFKVYVERDAVFWAMQVLLNPFRRLCQVAKPQVLSIATYNRQNRGRQLLCPCQNCAAVNRPFAKYVECWSNDLSSSQSSLKCNQLLEAYCKLENLLSVIKEHGHNAEPRFSQFVRLLEAARIARDSNSLELFRKVWDRVVAIWLEYLDHQKSLQSNVARSIDTINSVVKKRS